MGESAISVRNVKIKYRCFKKVSLLKSIFAPRKNKKIEYFEAVKGVSFEVEKGQISVIGLLMPRILSRLKVRMLNS